MDIPIEDFPLYQYIDYVRVWREVETPAPTTTTTTEPETTEATTTAGPDWQAICALPENDLATNLNFNRGKWGVGKTMFSGQRSTITRFNVKGRPATSAYNGAAFYARKYCGGD